MEIKTIEVSGLAGALYGMRMAFNSHNKQDSIVVDCLEEEVNVRDVVEGDYFLTSEVLIGENDMDLCKRLLKSGNEHAKYTRMIHVQAYFNMPRYWWSEFDTYKVGTVASSESTMHKLLNRKTEITLDNFEITGDPWIMERLQSVIRDLNELRLLYLEERDYRLVVKAKKILPENFLQARIVDMNYQTIRNIYHQRKNHRLKNEWIMTFCKWVESLPYADELIVKG